METVRLTGRRPLAVAGLTILVLLLAIGGLLVFQAVRPRVSQADATAVAVRQLGQMDPGVRGFVLVSARYNPAPDRVYDDLGNLMYSESRSACLVWRVQLPGWVCHADAAWVLHLRAPAQGGFRNHDAYVIVNAQNGTVSSSSSASTN
jgi:hypothetical protein